MFDIGVTSPPYNKRDGNKGWLVDKVSYSNSKDNTSEGKYQEEQILVLNEIYRITKPGGSFFYNHKIRRKKGVSIYPLEWLLKSDWSVKHSGCGVSGSTSGFQPEGLSSTLCTRSR